MTITGSSVDALAIFVAAALALVVILGIGGLFLVALFVNRDGPDEGGRRAFAVYLFGVAFITLWGAILGSIAVVVSAVNLIGTHTNRGSIGRVSCGVFTGRERCYPVYAAHAIGDAAARGMVVGGLLLVASGLTYYFHLRWGLKLAAQDTEGPALRVARNYVAVVLFTSILIVVPAVFLAIYALFELAGPGVFGGAGRIPSLRALNDAAYVALAVGVSFVAHLRLDFVGLWPWRRAAMLPPPPPPPPSAGVSATWPAPTQTNPNAPWR
jgi:hypothetical protein